MNSKSTPYLIVATTALIAILLAGWMTMIAVHQPWLGLTFDAKGITEGLRLEAVTPEGPSANLAPGTVLLRIDDGGDRQIALKPSDIVHEPDGLASYDAMARFFARQHIIHTILSADRVYLTFLDGTKTPVNPAPMRPLGELPAEFWMQIGVGLAGSIIASCVWALRPKMAGARALGASSLALLASTYPSAIYLSRELALGDPLFYILTTINPLGSLAFAVSLLVLFLVYPQRLISPKLIVVLIGGFGLWWLLDTLRIGFAGPGTGRYVPIGLTALAAPVMAGVQYWLTRNDPQLRTALGWFGLSLIVAAAIYVLAYVTPSLIGEPPFAPQALGYATALLVYGGIALGIIRYRLFDLDRWAFRILFYVGGAMIFAGLDVFLVSVVALDVLPAFSLALLIVALAYLPLRDFLARRLMPTPKGRSVMFQQVVETALTVDFNRRNQQWANLLRDIYDPLSWEESSDQSSPEISEDGMVLTIPGYGFVTPLGLKLAHGGRKLFSHGDLDLAIELCAMLLHASQSRDAHQRGTEQERDRIARDAHDNIGAKLLSALHGTGLERKDAMIREALSELRDIINHPSGAEQTLEETLAELRFETVERLSAAGHSLDWRVEGPQQSGISANIVHAVRSIIRESVSNTIRHAKASGMTISINLNKETLCLTISDDGRGLPETGLQGSGLGLESIHARLSALDGTLETSNLQSGFRLSAEIPITKRDPS